MVSVWRQCLGQYPEPVFGVGVHSLEQGLGTMAKVGFSAGGIKGRIIGDPGTSL